MTDVYLGLGSNLGDRDANLRAALEAIATLPGTMLVQQSPFYETTPMGPQDQGAYLNMAAQIQTKLEASALLDALQGIEQGLGRADKNQRRHWGPREIDIDILLFGDSVIDEPGLTVPHPGMHERWFVLKPLADIAPDIKHPTLKRKISNLLASHEGRNSHSLQGRWTIGFAITSLLAMLMMFPAYLFASAYSGVLAVTLGLVSGLSLIASLFLAVFGQYVLRPRKAVSP